MRKMTPVMLLAALLVSFSLPAAAQSKGGGGPGGQGAGSGNSPTSPGRATGFNRAQDRGSETGKEHRKGAEARKKGGTKERNEKAATPATPATPAVPGSPTTPAVPATPASPANK